MPDDTPFDPTQYTREEWEEVFQNALHALHANFRDAGAHDAMNKAKIALEAYDQAEAASPMERINAGIAGGAGELARRSLDPIRAVVGGGKLLFNLATSPEQTLNDIEAATSSAATGVETAALHPIDTFNKLQEQTPEQIMGHAVSGGELLLPAARLGRGLSMIPAAETAKLGPTVSGAIGEAAASPFKFLIGKARGVALDNALKAAKLAQGPLQEEILAERLGAAKGLTERQPGMGENLGLRNENLTLRNDILRGGMGGPPAPRSPLDELMPLADMPAPTTPPDLAKFLGTGPESITPEDLAKVQIHGAQPMAPGPLGGLPVVADPAAEALDKLRNLTSDQLAAQPMGQTPPLAESAAGPNAVQPKINLNNTDEVVKAVQDQLAKESNAAAQQPKPRRPRKPKGK